MDERVAELRVLVVEDEYLVAMLLEDMLTELGHRVIGIAGDVATALEMAQREEMEVAILDVNLGGAETYPIADVLLARGIPFLFATGYGRAGLPPPYRDAPVLQKPFQLAGLENAFAAIFAKSDAKT